MTDTYVPAALRKRITERARRRCGYCQTSEDVVGMPLEIDHIIPQALGGPTSEDNLWLACSPCNASKADPIVAVDLLTGAAAPLFDPLRQQWNEHFRWSEDGVRVVGLTPTGRATVSALNVNRPSLVRARRRWASVGWHPPAE